MYIYANHDYREMVSLNKYGMRFCELLLLGNIEVVV